MTATTLPRRPFSSLREFSSSVLTIMSKELRSRFRGRRAFLVLTIYIGVLALIAYGAYMSSLAQARVQCFAMRTAYGRGWVWESPNRPGSANYPLTV